ncbi:MAG: xylulokinase, partial [Caldilineaceae bacterium]
MNPRPRLVISMDSSTTACKALAWDAQGNAVAEGRASYPLRQPRPGFHEQSAEDWWSGACAALRACTAQVDPADIDGFAITHQRESFVVLDADGAPLRDAILWSDERSRSQVAWLERTFGRDALHQLTGKPPSMTASIAKVVWLMEHEGTRMARAATIVDVQGFLLRRLTGRRATSLASADPMGLIDMQQRCWAEDLLRDLGLRVDQFSDLLEPGAQVGVISPAAAEATGLRAGLPVFAGAGDGQCAGLGANATHPQRAYMNLGTAIAAGAFVPTYVADRAFRTLYAPVAGGFFIEHVLRGGVYTVTWFAEKFAPELRSTLLGAAPEV